MSSEQPARKTKRIQTATWAVATVEQRRTMIVDVALELLDERGLSAVTMRRVAGRLNVGVMTLYSYVNNQQDLIQAMVRRGFDMLNACCSEASTLNSAERWRGGSQAYLRFAMENPNLYHLMFDTPLPDDSDNLLSHGFSSLVEKIENRLDTPDPEKRSAQALRLAGPFWIGLHGLASLAIANRLDFLGADMNQLLDDLLARISPD